MLREGQHIVITGGSGGIGTPLVEKLLQRRIKVTLMGRSAGTVAGASHHPADLASPEGIQAAADWLRGQEVDGLIHLAGMQYFGPLEDQPYEALQRSYQLNLLAPVALTQAVLPQLRRQGGLLAYVGSTFGSIPFAHFAAYSSAKAGLKAFAEAMRRELAESPVQVSYIAPRAVDTPMNGELLRRFGQQTHMAMDAPEAVAERILTALIRGEKDVYIGFPECLFVRLNALFPRLIDRALRKNDRFAAQLFNRS